MSRKIFALKSSLAFILSTVCIATLGQSPAVAQSENVIHRFTRSTTDGGIPAAGLIADKHGNLYGTTVAGGAFDQGTVFQLTPPASTGGTWTQTILYSFTGGTDGAVPEGGLTLDAAGDLYGTTFYGGDPDYGAGVVFELAAPAVGSTTWVQTVLYAFGPGSTEDGENPGGNVVFDAAGNLYGVTAGGGASSAYCGEPGCGVIYQLKPPTVSGGAWTESVLYRFFAVGTNDGFSPTGVLVNPSGVLFGTTSYGGTAGVGTFFKLTPPAAGHTAWTETVLYSFAGGSAGSFPSALTKGSGGIYYGAVGLGGASNAGGVFELVPPASGGRWTANLVYSFTGGADGAEPGGPLTLDPAGHLYGAAFRGGISSCSGNGCGTVFDLIPPPPGGSWTERTLHDFSGGHDGYAPSGALLLTKGVLFGTTEGGGTSSNGYGTVYRVAP